MFQLYKNNVCEHPLVSYPCLYRNSFILIGIIQYTLTSTGFLSMSIQKFFHPDWYYTIYTNIHWFLIHVYTEILSS